MEKREKKRVFEIELATLSLCFFFFLDFVDGDVVVVKSPIGFGELELSVTSLWFLSFEHLRHIRDISTVPSWL